MNISEEDPTRGKERHTTDIGLGWGGAAVDFCSENLGRRDDGRGMSQLSNAVEQSWFTVNMYYSHWLIPR